MSEIEPRQRIHAIAAELGRDHTFSERVELTTELLAIYDRGEQPGNAPPTASWGRRAKADILTEISRLHVPGDGIDSSFCGECGHSFPCKTRRLADGDS